MKERAAKAKRSKNIRDDYDEEQTRSHNEHIEREEIVYP